MKLTLNRKQAMLAGELSLLDVGIVVALTRGGPAQPAGVIWRVREWFVDIDESAVEHSFDRMEERGFVSADGEGFYEPVEIAKHYAAYLYTAFLKMAASDDGPHSIEEE